MHELSVTQKLLELALDRAQRAGGGRIQRLHVVIGELSSMIDDSAAFYWDLISQGTAAEGAQLTFERVAAELACQQCGCRYQLKASKLTCPDCGSTSVSILAGDELLLQSIDLVRVAKPEKTSGRQP